MCEFFRNDCESKHGIGPLLCLKIQNLQSIHLLGLKTWNRYFLVTQKGAIPCLSISVVKYIT